MGPVQKNQSTSVGDLSLAIPKQRQGSFFPDWLVSRRRVDTALYAEVMEASGPPERLFGAPLAALVQRRQNPPWAWYLWLR